VGQYLDFLTFTPERTYNSKKYISSFYDKTGLTPFYFSGPDMYNCDLTACNYFVESVQLANINESYYGPFVCSRSIPHANIQSFITSSWFSFKQMPRHNKTECFVYPDMTFS